MNGRFQEGDHVKYEIDGLQCTGIVTAIEDSTVYIQRDRSIAKVDAVPMNKVRK